MYVLGIETSCDETAASIVKDGEEVLSNVVSSSLNEHKKYGGIIPEVAFRQQLETISEVTDSALKKAGLGLRKINLLSVTSGPGLTGSLLVGLSFAKAVNLSSGIPLLGINHLYAHIYASFLNHSGPKLPFVALVISGGHTSLFYVQDFDKIKTLGATSDDACGEAFDKVAKILSLGYPGGPVIERIARSGNPQKIKFSCSNTEKPLDFSFSGIKTAVLYYVRRLAGWPVRRLQNRQTEDIAASFQEAVIDALIRKSFLACKLKKINRLVIGGGVAANNRLRQSFYREAEKGNLEIYFPPKEFCLDNAAMVAGLGYQLFKKGHRAGLELNLSH
ncbi:MAG: tRNA (adenosine(37)-N6)-threonylcarbamoyltransferase complex transferase subunit TsaD [Candidatus Omnitrophica bacterium]|nr:tRNA (adenosine(37)-N6)-threonylcarbamoyltransferase complex transferase subunit TsaD [Candidatus Omnitrophota bacterium]MDD5592581.1 tRNA (adenosine(37)-N6)-threonylcarbamoyltransferase complex transferase subunit TsaD [Candidatus Omnitrophota bacterium]